MSKEIDELTQQRQRDWEAFVKYSKYGTVIIVTILAVVVIGWIAP